VKFVSLIKHLPGLLLKLGNRAYQSARKAGVELKSLKTEPDVGRSRISIAALDIGG
jgi:hypothetical protein